MNIRYLKIKSAAVAAVAIAGAIGLAACGGGNQPASAPSPAAPTAPLDGGQVDGTAPAGQVLDAGQFVGMSLDQAISFAGELGREWRVGREDGVDLPVTADLIAGRVTFTVEDGVVTEATIEGADS